MLTVLLGVAIVAGMGAAVFAWMATGPKRDARRLTREVRWHIKDLHSGHVDDLPRTGGPPDSGDAP